MPEVLAVNLERYVPHQSPWYAEYQVPPNASVSTGQAVSVKIAPSNVTCGVKPVLGRISTID
jgi:hypothetical protein